MNMDCIMRTCLSIILTGLLFSSCVTTKSVTKETSTRIRQVEIKSDSSSVFDTLDLMKDSKEWGDVEVIDPAELTVKIPKKAVIHPKTKKVRIDDKTTVDLEISTIIDSGKIAHKVAIREVAYEESTSYEKVEVKSSPNYMKWVLIIVGGLVLIGLLRF